MFLWTRCLVTDFQVQWTAPHIHGWQLFAVPSAWIQGLPGKSTWWLHGVSKHQRHSTAQRQLQGSGAQHSLRLAWFRQVTKYLTLWCFSLPWKHNLLHAPCTDSPKSWAFWQKASAEALLSYRKPSIPSACYCELSIEDTIYRNLTCSLAAKDSAGTWSSPATS